MDSESIPKDAETIQKLLETMDASAYDPRVVEQLMNFMYRYTAEVLQDAEAVSSRCGATQAEIGAQDVALAIQMRAKNSFVPPPPQKDLAKLAELKNTAPLPELKTRYGLRLPPESECLLNPSFQLPKIASTTNAQPRQPEQVSVPMEQDQQPKVFRNVKEMNTLQGEKALKIKTPSEGWQPPQDGTASDWPDSGMH